MNQDTVLLQKIEKTIQQNKLNGQRLSNMIGKYMIFSILKFLSFVFYLIDLGENEDQTSLTCINPTDCLQSNNNNYHREPIIHAPNDFPQMWNSL